MKKYDIIIIGAGIAGFTAAIYARRANKNVLVLESKIHGGQIITTFDIENWPGEPGISGADLMQKVYAQTTALGAEVEYEVVEKLERAGEAWRITTDENEYEARAIIVAVGSVDKPLGLPKEEKLKGRGVSYCATCDGALYKGKTVAVVGGGNTAFYDALYLAGICKKVYLVHRRAEFRADAALVDKVREKQNVEFVLESYPVEILGEKTVEGLAVKSSHREGSQADGSEKDILQEQGPKGERRELKADGIFVAVGRQPETGFLKGVAELDEHGYVVAGEDCHTSAPGIYVAGDCRTKTLRQLITAASDGAIAATEAVRSLH